MQKQKRHESSWNKIQVVDDDGVIVMCYELDKLGKLLIKLKTQRRRNFQNVQQGKNSVLNQGSNNIEEEKKKEEKEKNHAKKEQINLNILFECEVEDEDENLNTCGEYDSDYLDNVVFL
ncbi:hypothetical protein M9Y10_032419 [Tritrichomonas musculus]|uniref:Uncharacterized protein n=1 Tax=Tritrichomonas musculus TaxID=1915356 RepID=A0ABR2GYD6_9EUKA